MEISQFHSWWTLALLVIFVGIVIWAYSGKRKKDFDEAARIPLEDDDTGLDSRRAESDDNG